MEEKKLVYQIILDIWNLTKNFFFDESIDWDAFIYEANNIADKYKDCNQIQKDLFKELFLSIQHYGEKKQ